MPRFLSYDSLLVAMLPNIAAPPDIDCVYDLYLQEWVSMRAIQPRPISPNSVTHEF